jgi:hypothetical protein
MSNSKIHSLNKVNILHIPTIIEQNNIDIMIEKNQLTFDLERCAF